MRTKTLRLKTNPFVIDTGHYVMGHYSIITVCCKVLLQWLRAQSCTQISQIKMLVNQLKTLFYNCSEFCATQLYLFIYLIHHTIS